jgi:hypothetical protein
VSLAGISGACTQPVDPRFWTDKLQVNVQGCQMVSFQTKNPTSGKIERALDWKMLIYFMSIWNILWTFGMFYDPLVHLCSFGTFFSGFGIMYREKSGNPANVAVVSTELNSCSALSYKMWGIS